MLNKNLVFNGVETLCMSGDIHGKFNDVVWQIDERYKMENSLTIVCGDIGIGFESKEHYKQIFPKLDKRLGKRNNHLVLFRGNHCDPSYYNNPTLNKEVFGKLKHIHVIPDYTVIDVNNSQHCILCIGGGLSIDRTQRVEGRSYWKDEDVVYDQDKINSVCMQYFGLIDIVCTHTKPWKQLPPQEKGGLLGWTVWDNKIADDVDRCDERMEQIFKWFSINSINPKHWYYGHYHFHETGDFTLLDHLANQEYNAKYYLLDCNEIIQHREE